MLAQSLNPDLRQSVVTLTIRRNIIIIEPSKRNMMIY